MNDSCTGTVYSAFVLQGGQKCTPTGLPHESSHWEWTQEPVNHGFRGDSCGEPVEQKSRESRQPWHSLSVASVQLTVPVEEKKGTPVKQCNAFVNTACVCVLLQCYGPNHVAEIMTVATHH